MDGVNAASGKINLQWFSHKDGFATLKEEYKADFQSFLVNERLKYQDAYMHSANFDSERPAVKDALHPGLYIDRTASVFGRMIPLLQNMLTRRGDNA